MADKLIIKVDGDTSDFAKKLGSLGKKSLTSFNNFSNGVSSGVKKITGVAAGAIGALSAIGVNYNKDMEMYTSNFKVMLGSQEAALKKVEELKEFAAKTPFAMEDLAQGTKTLLAFGIESDKSTEILGQLGDVALGDKEKFASLATVFGQVSSAGKLQGQDLMQLINAGFNPLQVISEQTGQSMAELKDQMAAGGISAEMMADAFKVATSEGGQFYNGMSEASLTTEGLISTLKDNATALVGEVFEPLSSSILQDLLPAALGYIDQLSTAFKKDGVDGLVEAVGDILGSVLNEITAKLPDLLEAGVSLITALLKGIADNASSIAETIGTLIEGMKEGFEEATPLLMEIAEEVISNLALGFVEYKALIYETAIQLLLAMAQGIADNTPTLVEQLFAMVEHLIGVIVESAPKFIEAGVTALQALAQGIADNFPTLVTQVIDGIITIGGAILDNLQPILEAGLEIIVALGEGIIEALPDLIAQLPDIISAMVDFFIGAIPQIIQAGIDLLLALIDALPEIIDAIVDALPQIIVGITNGLIKAIPQLAVAGFKLFVGIVKSLPEIIASIVRVIPAIISAILQAFSAIGAKMESVGTNIVKGIWEGISGSLSWIKDKITGWVGDVVKFIKKLFKINSPSKVTKDEVGFFVGAGVGEGITDSTPLVLKSAKKQMNALKGAYSAAQSMFTFGGNYGAGNYATTNNTTTKSTTVAPVMNFYEPVESPDTVAREVDKIFTYGLAGAY